MALTRRKTLALVGGGFVAAAGGFGAHVLTPPNRARAPWANAGRYDDPRMRALSWAILAPNPHNRQPWKIDLSEPDVATVYVDTDRLLPHTDPFSRQITIGFGCFLEVLRMAAAEEGIGVDIVSFPEGMDPQQLDARPVARCVFTPQAASPDPLFAQVPHRRSVKEPYDTSREVSSEALAQIVGAVANGSIMGATNVPDEVMALREVSAAALMIEIETPHTYKESVDLFRIGRKEVNENPDGIDFSGPLFETLGTFGLFTRSAALQGESTVYQQGVDAVIENCETAMAHIWQVTNGNTRADHISAGRDWVRLHLAATELGIAVQPLSQALQEYPEMSELYRDIHGRLAPDGGTIQMFARLGYGPDVAPSPRWSVEEKVVEGT